jgi:large subunit ribosomal protein L21
LFVVLTQIANAAIFQGLCTSFFQGNMYAIIRSGDKQFRAEPGMTIRVPSIDAEPGETVTFGEVLVAGTDDGTQLGSPTLAGASVTGEVIRHGKDKKVIIFKWKRRKNYRRKQGHRQKFTEVRIGEIKVGKA